MMDQVATYTLLTDLLWPRPYLYFQCDFTWDMAVEADCIAWCLWKQEQAAQKGKGKGKGQPADDAPPQTFEV